MRTTSAATIPSYACRKRAYRLYRYLSGMTAAGFVAIALLLAGRTADALLSRMVEGAQPAFTVDQARVLETQAPF